MKKYRIIVETEKSGNKWYYAQKKDWLWGWNYISTNGFGSIDEAKRYIQGDVNYEYKQDQEKIVKKEILNQ